MKRIISIIVCTSLILSIPVQSGTIELIDKNTLDNLREVSKSLGENLGSNVGLSSSTREIIQGLGYSLENTAGKLSDAINQITFTAQLSAQTSAHLSNIIKAAGITTGGCALMMSGVYTGVSGIKDFFATPQAQPLPGTPTDWWQKTKTFCSHQCVRGLGKVTAGTGMFIGGLLMVTKCDKLLVKLS